MSITTTIEHDPAPSKAVDVPRAQAVTPMEMLQQALSNGQSMDVLERLMDLNDRFEKGQARKSFIDAKAAFKAEAPAIDKDKKNSQYDSSYASIGSVVNTMNPILSKHGLDASWDIDQSDADIKVTCTLSHRDGHSHSVSMRSKPDDTGKKNAIQQVKSAITYLKVATYEAVVGVASNEANTDDDGNSVGVAPINDVQAKTIADLLDDTASDVDGFLTHFGIKEVKELPARRFNEAMNIFAAKRKLKNG